jgi:flagellar hook assembly protein FlgD
MRSSGKADLKNLYTQGIEFVESSIEDGVIPKEFTVSQAYPNPFNGNVAIDVTIAEVEPVTFSITNVLGQKVFQQTLLPDRAGSFRINWNGRDILQRNLPSGIYIYSVMTNTNIVNGKCTYLK